MHSASGTDNDPQLEVEADAGNGGNDAPDPNFPIEGGGGAIDDGGQVHTGPPPPKN